MFFLMCGKESQHLSQVKSTIKNRMEKIDKQHGKPESLEILQILCIFYKSCTIKHKPWDI